MWVIDAAGCVVIAVLRSSTEYGEKVQAASLLVVDLHKGQTGYSLASTLFSTLWRDAVTGTRPSRKLEGNGSSRGSLHKRTICYIIVTTCQIVSLTAFKRRDIILIIMGVILVSLLKMWEICTMSMLH